MSRFEILLVLGMVAVTFPVRYLPLVAASRRPLPPALRRALEYVPVAVLTAICTPTVFLTEGRVHLGIDNPYLFGSLAAVVLAWRWRNLLLTIGGGLAVFVLWKLALAL